MVHKSFTVTLTVSELTWCARNDRHSHELVQSCSKFFLNTTAQDCTRTESAAISVLCGKNVAACRPHLVVNCVEIRAVLRPNIQ